MGDVDTLKSRIDAEFSAEREKIARFRTEQVKEYQDRQRRLGLFEKACEQLRAVWAPRLEALSERFGQSMKVSPKVTPRLREAVFSFKSELALIELRFAATTDEEVRKLVLDYDLRIIPVLMKYEPHARIELPLEKIDASAVVEWLDDRILDFVRAYLSLHENEHYLKDQMVVDPVAGVRFPRFAAAATLESKGETFYFIGEETKCEYERQLAKG